MFAIWCVPCVAVLHRAPFFKFVLALQRTGLGSETMRMLHTPNAGGSSVNSEAISLEMLQAVFGAELSLLETEVRYVVENCSIVDYVVRCFDHDTTVGVSVTRAMVRRRCC